MSNQTQAQKSEIVKKYMAKRSENENAYKQQREARITEMYGDKFPPFDWKIRFPDLIGELDKANGLALGECESALKKIGLETTI